jgi:GAF domain-containing protein
MSPLQLDQNLSMPSGHSTISAHDLRQRVATLQAMAVLDTPPEEGFDAIARLAATVCATPVAVVSLIDGERLWFKSVHGLGMRTMDSSNSFCCEAANSKRLLEVPNPDVDPRFSDHPMVVGELGIRYHAGAPIMHNGVGIGTVCVLDYVPRRMDKRALEALSEMANIAAVMLTARIEAFELFSNTRS